MTTVLIICGAGASSTFLASRMRALAASRGLEITVSAASESELRTRLHTTSVLLVGPHLEPGFAAIAAEAAVFGVPAALLPQNAFAPGGAELAVDLVASLLTTSAASS